MCEERDHRGGRDRGAPAGQNSRFLNLEISKVLLDASSRAAHAALEQLLVERVKERLAERMGSRLEALADLAVDDMMADLEANLDIERRIQARAEQQDTHLERLRDIFGDQGDR